MNNKGFIATSILYSFFIVFCAMLLTYIGVLGHNSILVNKEKDLINEELHSRIYLSDASIGTYFRLNVCSSSPLFNSGDTINYVLINKNVNNYTMLSSVVSYKLNSYELLNEVLNKININYAGNKIISRSMSKADYNIINGYSNVELKSKILNIEIIDYDSSGNKIEGYYLLANNPNMPNNNYSGSESYYTKTKTLIDASNTLSNLSYMYIRLTFDITNNYRIISGDGTYSNPYIMEGGASCS